MARYGSGPAGGEGGEHTCLFAGLWEVDFFLSLCCFNVEREALQLSEERRCDSKWGPRPFPGILSWPPAEGVADRRC